MADINTTDEIFWYCGCN